MSDGLVGGNHACVLCVCNHNDLHSWLVSFIVCLSADGCMECRRAAEEKKDPITETQAGTKKNMHILMNCLIDLLN